MELKKNVAEIKRLLQERKQGVRSYSALTRFLISKGIQRTLAEEITLDFTKEQLAIEGLPSLLAKRIRTTNTPSDNAIALVGPTGVGKSSIVSKLEGEHVALYDTPGCNFYQTEMIDVIGENLAESGISEVWLVLSVAMQEVDLFGAIYQFSALQPTSLIFTKFDETLAPGVLLNVTTKCELPIRYITTEHSIQLADPYEITHRVLTENNQEEFQTIRQLIYSEYFS